MEREAANAKWQRLHGDRQWHNGSWTSWSEKPSADHPYHRDHGLRVGVAREDLRPDDRFLSVENCGPPVGQLVAPRHSDDAQGNPNES